jgi:hypothetical protein
MAEQRDRIPVVIDNQSQWFFHSTPHTKQAITPLEDNNIVQRKLGFGGFVELIPPEIINGEHAFTYFSG